MSMREKLQRVKKRRSIYPLILFMGIVVILGANHLTTPSNPNSNPNIQYAQVSWAIHYDSIEEMTIAPRVDVIAKGVIIDATSFEKSIKDGSGVSLFFTNFSFKVHQVFKGGQNLDVMAIIQTGGTLNGRTKMILDDPLMQVGDELILFLHLDERSGDPGKYAVAAGPQGRFVVKGGRVLSLGEIPSSADERVNQAITMMTEPLHTGGIREAEFRQQIQAALSTN